MFWRHSKNETKALLTATLFLFSAYTLLLAQSWNSVIVEELQLDANSVGVYAGVEENEVNLLMAQLDEREKTIEAREYAISQQGLIEDETLLLMMSIMGASLLGLILLNFYLDSKKRVSFA